MQVVVTRAGKLHASGMSDLLNEVIQAGGTTALTQSTTADDLASWMSAPRSAWHVAEAENGDVMGFQWIAPSDKLPVDAADIATFARVGSTGLGIGSKLFKETVKSARALGYNWINANIREDNFGGLAYYQSRGFEDYGRIENHRLEDGSIVNKILKRYDLT